MTTIARIDTIRLDIPFGDHYDGPRVKPRGWTQRDVLLVRVETGDGIVGWGEAFAYACATVTEAAIRDMYGPRLIGQACHDIAALSREMQRQLHIQGRYGITIFAWSGIEMALWDAAAKRTGVSLATLLGGRRRGSVPAYASLVRYGGAREVRQVCAKALADGYRDVKLHEIAYEPIAAGRDAVGRDVRLTTDVNCNWSLAETEAMLPKMKALDLYWVEEPIWPPEDFDTLARLEEQFGVALAAGENACTAFQFQGLIPAVTFVQPSVTKIGGILEFMKVVDAARLVGKQVMPHSPYFGPGWWATLQLAAHAPEIGLIEYLYIESEGEAGKDIPLPKKGMIQIPDAPGLGFEPDFDAIDKFRVG
jgi:L-alanine-DL-glutamate epimerase-like enolase superfamily enzyme